MRPDLTYLAEQFSKYNAQCFGGSLPLIALRINHAATRLGTFSPHGVITLTDCYDLTPDQIDDVLIHEMIHYLLHITNRRDSTPHGPNFRAVMNSINALHGRHITVRTHLTPEVAESAQRPRLNVVGLLTFADGTRGLCVCGKGSLAKIHRAFSRSKSVKTIEWHYTFHPWFSRYPLLRTPRYYSLPADLPTHFLTPLTI